MRVSQAIKRGLWPSPAANDLYLLHKNRGSLIFALPGYGANNSTPATDITGNALVWSGANAKVVTTGSPLFYDSWVTFGGNAGNSRVYSEYNPKFNLGVSRWTIRWWANVTDTTNAQVVAARGNNAWGTWTLWQYGSHIRFQQGGVIVFNTSATFSSITAGVHHFELGYDLAKFYLFYDGTLVATASAANIDLTDIAANERFSVGNLAAQDQGSYGGQLFDFAMLGGVCLHKNSFTRPTLPLLSVAGYTQ